MPYRGVVVDHQDRGGVVAGDLLGIVGRRALGLLSGRLLVRLGGERHVQAQHLMQIEHQWIGPAPRWGPLRQFRHRHGIRQVPLVQLQHVRNRRKIQVVLFQVFHQVFHRFEIRVQAFFLRIRHEHHAIRAL